MLGGLLSLLSAAATSSISALHPPVQVSLPLVARFKTAAPVVVLFAGAPEASLFPKASAIVSQQSGRDDGCEDAMWHTLKDGTMDAVAPAGCNMTLLVRARWSELHGALNSARLSGTHPVHPRTTACSDGVDNDGDGFSDYPVDSGCRSAADDDERSSLGPRASPWSHRVDPVTGCLLELNVSGGRRVLWDEHERVSFAPNSPWATSPWASHCLHSTTTSTQHTPQQLCWNVSQGSSYSVECDVKHTLVSDSATHLRSTSSAGGVEVADTLAFEGSSTLPVVTISFTVRNTLAQAVNVTLPLQFGGLQLGSGRAGSNGSNGSGSGLYRLRPDRAGTIERNYSGTLGCLGNGCDYPLRYPLSIQTFSPLSALGDDGTATTGPPPMSVALQWTTPALHPDYRGSAVHMYTLVEMATSPLLTHLLTTELDPFETKSFTAALSVALTGPDDHDQVRRLFTPYAAYFKATYGGDEQAPPLYCPQGPWSWTHGPNMARGLQPPAYDDKTFEWLRPVTLAELMREQDGALEAMGSAGIGHVGVWATALDSSFMSISGERDEFNPVTEAIAPMIDASRDPKGVIGALDAKLKAVDSRLFWFARPCEDIENASVTYPGGAAGEPLVTKGRIISHFTNDLNASKGQYAKQMRRIAHWLDDVGVSGFYFDQMDCRGALGFIQDVYSRWPDVFIAREGAQDVAALYVPQIPIVKFGLPTAQHRGTAQYPPENSVLLPLLAPFAEMFAGPFDVPLVPGETDDELEQHNYTAIIAAGPEKAPLSEERCAQIKASYARRYQQWLAYGQKRGCAPVPASPPPCGRRG